jgi:hypothetical protein
VHPDNQSYKGTTTLCQPIGEAVILFSSMISSILKLNTENPLGDYWYKTNKDEYFFEIDIPEDYRENKVVEPEIFSYKARLISEIIQIGAYDKDGNLIEGNMDHLHPLYKLLPTFCVLLAREMEKNSQFSIIMEKFVENPEPDTFVNLCEDFYQAHKDDEYILMYEEVPKFNKEKYRRFSDIYKIISENKNILSKNDEIKVNRFSEAEFSEEQKSNIPNLSEAYFIQARRP